MNWTVAVIEDDEVLAAAMRTMLESRGARVECFYDAPAPEDLAAQNPDLVILDCILATTSGPDYLKLMREYKSLADVAVIMTTGYDEFTDGLHTLEGPKCTFLQKPFSGEALEKAAQQLFRH